MKPITHLLAGAALALALSLSPGPVAAGDIKIGYITDLSGPLAGSYTPTWEGFELYMKAANDRGGFGGSKVSISLDDDGLRADRAVAAAKKQVEQEGVVGIFGLSLSSTQGPVLTEARKAGVPVATSFSGILDMLPPAKPYSYSTGVVFEVAGEAIGQLAQRIAPAGKVVGMTFDSVGGRAALRHNMEVAKKLGYQWDEVIFPIRTSDFTPFAQAAAAMRPDIVVGHYGAEQNVGMIPALRAAGYTGPYVIAAYGASEKTAEEAAALAGSPDNIYMVSRYVPATSDVPGLADLKAAAEAHGVSELTSMHVTGWVLGMLVGEALGKCGGDCTRDRLDAALSGATVDSQGLTGGPVVMSAEDHYGPTYWGLYKWDGARLVQQGDWLRKQALEVPLQ